MPTVVDILSLAPTASYLAANDIGKSNLFGKPKINQILPQQIYAWYMVLSKIYSLDPTYNLTAYCNYLWEIMGSYGVKAQGIVGGSGSVSPITPIVFPDELHFTVSGSTPIATNATSGDLSAYGYIGFNVLVVMNNSPLSTVNNGLGSIYYSWDKTTAIIYFYQGSSPLNIPADQIFDIYPIASR